MLKYFCVAASADVVVDELPFVFSCWWYCWCWWCRGWPLCKCHRIEPGRWSWMWLMSRDDGGGASASCGCCSVQKWNGNVFADFGEDLCSCLYKQDVCIRRLRRTALSGSLKQFDSISLSSIICFIFVVVFFTGIHEMISLILIWIESWVPNKKFTLHRTNYVVNGIHVCVFVLSEYKAVT